MIIVPLTKKRRLLATQRTRYTRLALRLGKKLLPLSKEKKK